MFSVLRVIFIAFWSVLCGIAISAEMVFAARADTKEGGVYLVMRERAYDAKTEYMEKVWQIVRDALVAERSTVGFISRELRLNGNLYIIITEPAGARHASEVVTGALSEAPGFPGMSSPGFAVQVEGSRLVVALDEESSNVFSEYLTDRSVSALALRLKVFGLEGGRIDVLENEVIRFFAFDTKPVSELIYLFETQGRLSLRSVVGRSKDSSADAGAGNELLPFRNKKGSHLIVERRDIIKNEDFLSFESTFDGNGHPAIGFRLSVEGTQTLTAHTRREMGGVVAIVLDNEVISTNINVIRIPGDEGVIAGEFDQTDANRLVSILNAGGLPTKLDVVQYREISSPLDLPN
jgi:preprotein translocase subunit SecD